MRSCKRTLPKVLSIISTVVKVSKSTDKTGISISSELEAMRHVWGQDLVDMIRANLALPMHKRTHFLRKRLPNGGSTL